MWNGDAYISNVTKAEQRRNNKVLGLRRIKHIICDNEIEEYCDLLDYLDEEAPELFEWLLACHGPVKAYLDSRRNKRIAMEKAAALEAEEHIQAVDRKASHKDEMEANEIREATADCETEEEVQAKTVETLAKLRKDEIEWDQERMDWEDKWVQDENGLWDHSDMLDGHPEQFQQMELPT